MVADLTSSAKCVKHLERSLGIMSNSKQEILDDIAWSKMKPLGMTTTLQARVPLKGNVMETVYLALHHTGNKKHAEIEIVVPIFSDNVIHWRNSKKALLYLGDILVDSDFQISMDMKEESERMEVHYTTPYQTAIKSIETALGHALRNWFYGQDPEIQHDTVQLQIDAWFANGPEWRVLKLSPIAQEDQNNGIIIKSNQLITSHAERLKARIFNPELWSTIDLNSTSIGEYVNESFRLSNGASIQGPEVIPSPKNEFYCKVLAKHAIGLGMNPKRAYTLRNIYEQTVDLVNTEDPIVTRYEPDEKVKLNGVNLLTALMHLEHHTYEDGIAISQRAARLMKASRIIVQLIESDLPVTCLVEPGDSVDSNSVIALDGEHHVLASKLIFPGIVEAVEIFQGKRFGIITNRCWIKYRSFYPMENGDKISNRHGGKGVITIIPDKDMPWCPDTGQQIDICIGPESVINRKAMSVMWEMMLCKRQWQELRGQRPTKQIKVPLTVEVDGKVTWPTDDDHNFEKLAHQYGQKLPLVYKGQQLPELVFFGHMFWMRLDKFSREIVSAVGNKKKTNSFGATIDNAKLSGQRCNLAKILAMTGRNMGVLPYDVIDSNMSGRRFFTNLVHSIRNESFHE